MKEVVVTTQTGSSAPLNVNVQSVAPAFFPWPANQPVATHLDFSYAAKNGTFSIPTVAAKPNEIIVLWGTGFGLTSPAAPAGQTVPPSVFAVIGVQVAVGSQTANVIGAALAPGLAGVYQVAIQVPASLADGDYPVTASVGGTQSASGAILSVHK